MESESYVSPLLATAALVAVFGMLLVLIAAEVPSFERLRDLLYFHGQKLMTVVAVAATSSSLYYSEVVGFIPCEFCWFQRTMMYSLAVLLVTALVTRSRLDSRYVSVLSLIGLGLSTYHYQLQLFPEQSAVCSSVVPCTGRYVDEYGFITIPFMAGCCFLTILLLQVAQRRIAYVDRRNAERPT